jgi:hypothetical protein
MASKLKFDSPSSPPGGERKLVFDKAPVTPAGPPSPPISGLEPLGGTYHRDPSVPISQGNIDTTGMPEDPKITEENKHNARIQAIADSLRKNEFPTGVADFTADKFALGTTRAPTALANALLMRLQGKHPDEPFGNLYRGSDRYINERMDRAETNTGPLAPMVGAVASLPASMYLSGTGRTAGAPAAVTPGVRAPATAPASTTKVMLDAAKPGFVEGAAQNAETLEDALKGGAKNAAASAIVAGGADKVTQYALPASRRGAAAEAQASKGVDPVSLKDTADTFYKQMDAAGVAYDVRQTIPLNRALRDMQQSLRYSPNAHQPLTDYFDQALALSRRPASYRQLQDLRSAFAGETSNSNPNVRRAAGEVLGHIDDLIRTPPAINPQGLDMAKTHPEASRLWRASNLAADLDLKSGKAGRMVEAGKDINPDAKLRDDLFNIRERTLGRKYNPFDDNQQELLDRAIEGSRGENFKRNAGNFLVSKAPTIGATAGAGTTLAGITHGNSPGWAATTAAVGFPFWAGAHYGGKAMQKSAAGARMQDVNALLRDITGSPNLPKGAAISRDDLAKILFAQDLERIAPRLGEPVVKSGLNIFGNQQEE